MLEKRAEHLHRQVERYRNDPRHTERDFEALADAYYQPGDDRHGETRQQLGAADVTRLGP